MFNSKGKIFKAQSYDVYFLISKVEYPYEKETHTETAYVKLPGDFVDIEFCSYLEFPKDSNLFSYDNKTVNGIEDAKVNLYLRSLPSFIQIEDDLFNNGK